MKLLRPEIEGQLGAFERSLYDAVRAEVAKHEGRTVDPSLTFFEVLNLPIIHEGKETWTGTTVECHVRRLAGKGLDLDIGFSITGPLIHGGPTVAVIPVQREHDYRIWEIRFLDTWGPVDPKEVCGEVADVTRMFVRDWLRGHLVLTTVYANSTPYKWVLKRSNEILGVKRRPGFLPWFRARRKVSQST